MLPPGDVLVIAGDFTNRGRPQEIHDFQAQVRKCIRTIGYSAVVAIAGNHDLMFERSYSDAIKLLDPNPGEGFYYLQDSGCEINGVKFFGQPWQPFFCNWAFNVKTEAELQEKWNLCPDDTDVWITHGPPAGILDMCPDGRCVGSTSLLDAAMNRVKPRLHVFGHIHHSYGEINSMKTKFVNAATCNEQYLPVNPPIVVNL